MDKVSLRRDISAILGMAIPKGGYWLKFAELDQKGRFNNREIIKILAILCERVENIEDDNEPTIEPRANTSV